MKLDSLALPDLSGWARGCGRVWEREVTEDEGGEGRVGGRKPPAVWFERVVIVRKTSVRAIE